MDNIFSLMVSIDVYLEYHDFLFVSHIRFLSNPWNDSEICHPRVSFLMDIQNVLWHKKLYVTKNQPLIGRYCYLMLQISTLFQSLC